MKFAVALVLVAAAVQANYTSLHTYGWTPGKEYTFHYESQVLSGIPKINDQQYAGVQLSCNVRVQAFSDYSLRLKLQDVSFKTFNGDLKLNENGRIVGQPGSSEGHLPEEFKHQLEQPFLAHLKSGILESFYVGKEEPVAVTNIKKAVLSQLQLDISGSQRSQLESNSIQIPTPIEGSTASEEISYFTTNEQSLHGECLTKYTVHRLPEYKAKELEEMWTVEERQLNGVEYETASVESIARSGSQQAKAECEGKKYFQVTKTKDFDRCTVRPTYQKWTGFEGNCNTSKSGCGELMTDMSSSTIFVCGEISDFHIRKIVSESVMITNPLMHSTKEQLKVSSKVNVELLKSNSISQRIELPSGMEQQKTLIYSLRNEQSGSFNEETVKETEAFLGVRPMLPQPGLHEAPNTPFSIQMNKEQIVSQCVEQLRKMSSLVFESPESCSSNSDVAGLLIQVTEHMSKLSYSELKQLENKIQQLESGSGSSSQEQIKPIVKMFYEALSMVGTSPSTMLVVEKVKSGNLPKSLLNKMISYCIRNVKYPTQQLLRELVQLAKCQTVKSSEQLTSTTLVHLSNLFYHAYVNPSTMVSNYPVKMYGIFGTEESTVLTQEYIPYLIEMIEQAGGSHHQVQLAAISALGKVGHMKALKTLLKVAEGKYSEEPMIRSLAVYSLKRVTKRNQPQLKPIILSLINNPAETPEVRIAAVSILPWCMPTASDLQKLAVRSWMEPSKQVSSFFASTIKSLVHTKVPELVSLSSVAKMVLPMLKSEEYGVQYSHNLHYSTFVDYLKTVVSQKWAGVSTKDGIFPSRIEGKTELYLTSGTAKYSGLSFTAYTSGMDSLLDKYLHYFSKATQASSNVKEQLQKIVEELQIQTRQMNSPKLFAQASLMGLESSLYLDSETVLEALDSASRHVQGGLSSEFHTAGSVKLQEAYSMVVSEAGFPVFSSFPSATTYSIKGYFKSNSVEGSIVPEVTAKIIPVVNFKAMSTHGILCPFTNEVIGAGVQLSAHSTIPVEAKAKISRGQVELSVKVPSETEKQGSNKEVAHVFVMPFTFKQNLHSAQSLCKSGNLKKILSETPRTHETNFGESFGIKGQLIMESNDRFDDVAAKVQLIKQNSPLSIFAVAGLPSSLRYFSTKVVFQPSQSQTKEFQVAIKLSTKGSGEHHAISSGPINEGEMERLGFSSIKETLNKLEGGFAALVEVTATTKGQYSGKSFETAFVVGTKQENEGSCVKSYAAVNYKPTTHQQAYGIRYESETKYPTLKNRWNIEGLLQENMQVEYQGQVAFGYEASGKQEIKLTGSLFKSEAQKEAVMHSQEYKQCKQEENRSNQLSLSCRKVRLQAAALDKFQAKVHVPKTISQSPLVGLAGGMLESYFLAQTSLRKVREGSETSQMWTVEGSVNRDGTIGQFKVEAPCGMESTIKNIRLYGYSVLPFSIHNNGFNAAIQYVSKNQIPATCSVEPNLVNTFDGESYGYTINDCSHLLLKDRSGKIPIAVMTRTTTQGLKSVKILSGEFDIELNPQGSGSQEVKVNGKSWSLERNKEWKQKDSEGSTVAEFKRYQDDVYMVYVANQMLTIWTDGKKIEIVAPQLMSSHSMGLCGDMNGEKSADTKTPKFCVMTPKLSAVSYILNKHGSQSPIAPRCSGIPSELREQYEHESQRCIKEQNIHTQLTGIYNRIKALTQPIVSAHVVERQAGQVCISKSMIKVCSGSGSGSQGLKPRTLTFVCVSAPSSLGQSLEKRALSGEPLMQELEQLPVAFRKTAYEPVYCSTLGGRATRSSWESQGL